MEKIFVTTFNKVIFKKFGRKLLESFVNTKQSIPFFCYVEENLSEYPHFENITYLNIFKEQPECQKFVNRNLKKNKNNSNISYLLDSVRFNYKVFAQNDARKYADKIYFIDADTCFLTKIPTKWLDECLPNDTFISLYDRIGYYTETGFLAFNTKIKNKIDQKISDIFFQQYIGYYSHDLIYCLPAFTDCHALDATRWRFLFLNKLTKEYSNYKENRLGNWSSTNDLDVMSDDKFINQYIIHHKGNKS